MKKEYTIRYEETYYNVYEVAANSEEEAKKILLNRIHTGDESGPENCCGSNLQVLAVTNIDGREVEEVYAEEADTTFIMEYTYRDGELIAEQVIGFYHGYPNSEDTKTCSGMGTVAILI